MEGGGVGVSRGEGGSLGPPPACQSKWNEEVLSLLHT